MPIPGINPVSLMMPGMAETQVGLQNIERQRAIAQLLQQQSMQPMESPVAHGPMGSVTAPISWTNGLAKLMQGYTGSRMGQDLDAKQLALIKGLSGQYSGLFGGGQQQPTASSPESQALPSVGGSTPENTTAPSNGPLQMPGVSPQQSQLMYGMAPDKYMESLIKGMAGPDINKVTDALGIQRGSPEYKAILQKALAKETHTPMDIVRQNSIALDANGNVKAYSPPPIPGAFPQFQGGMPTGYAQAPGAQAIMAGNAAATSGGQAAGKAPYETETFNTEGAPTMMTREQAIQAATGRPMPTPGQLGTQPQGMKVTPQVQASRDQTRMQILQDELKANPNDIALKTEISNEQKKQIPGLRLQDQGAGAAQRSAGEHTAAEVLKGLQENYSRLRDVPQQLQNIESAKAIVSQAKGFMGPAGESLLGAAKLLNDRLGTSINVQGVKGAEELRTRIFMNVMDNLKKMDAQPSQLQQQIMQQALGSLGTDPGALPKMLDAYSGALQNKVGIYHQQVDEAKSIGVNWPHKIGTPKAPTGVDDKLWSVMTPEERALWTK